MSDERSTEDRTALADRVYRDLLRSIVVGGLEPGTWLKEREISERFEVSRIPVREALHRLESEGFVVTSPHRGASVTPVERADVEELFDARLCIEPYAARKAAFRVHAGIESAEPLRELLQKSMSAPTGDESGEMSLHFHSEIVRLSGNGLLVRSLKPMLGRMEWIFRLTHHARDEEDALEHKQLLDAILSGRGEFAAAHAYTHIELGREPILAALAEHLGW